MRSGAKYPCPCCGYLTLPEEPPGTYTICAVCFWEDDGLQYEEPARGGGANEVSLVEARANFATFGAVTREDMVHVRPPLPEETPLQT